MKNWKIENNGTNSTKLVVSTSSMQSKGVYLMPGQMVLSAHKTPHMDAQWRRKLIKLEANFDNTPYGFELGVVYDISQMDKIKYEKAKRDAKGYMDK